MSIKIRKISYRDWHRSIKTNFSESIKNITRYTQKSYETNIYQNTGMCDLLGIKNMLFSSNSFFWFLRFHEIFLKKYQILLLLLLRIVSFGPSLLIRILQYTHTKYVLENIVCYLSSYWKNLNKNNTQQSTRENETNKIIKFMIHRMLKTTFISLFSFSHFTWL